MNRRIDWFPFWRRNDLPETRAVLTDPVERMMRMMEEPPRFTDDGGPFVPRLAVSEDAEAVHVSCELPGIEAKDIDVTMQHGRLRIRGEKKSETDRKEDGLHYNERRYGAFERVIQVPMEIDDAKILAAFEKGVLKVMLPKVHAESAAMKKIEIRT